MIKYLFFNQNHLVVVYGFVLCASPRLEPSFTDLYYMACAYCWWWNVDSGRFAHSKYIMYDDIAVSLVLCLCVCCLCHILVGARLLGYGIAAAAATRENEQNFEWLTRAAIYFDNWRAVQSLRLLYGHAYQRMEKRYTQNLKGNANEWASKS